MSSANGSPKSPLRPSCHAMMAPPAPSETIDATI
jgi:hypothetical protein